MRQPITVLAAALVTSSLALGACRPSGPELREPTAAQRSSTTLATTTTVPPSIDTAPPSSTTAPAPTSGAADPSAVPPSSAGSSDPSDPVASSVPATGAAVLPDGPTTVAQVRAGLDRVEVFDAPGAPSPSQTIASPGEYGNPQVFVVVERRPERWLRVLLPVRPNASNGWIREDDVTLVTHDYRIRVSLSGFRIEVTRGDEVVLEAPIGVGTSDTPTPAATYYTWVLLAPTNSGYGQYAYGLSGYSEVLDEFAGGDARLGIHGTDDESSIGRNVSHGCIRVSDETVIRMVEDLGLPLGVPVEVDV